MCRKASFVLGFLLLNGCANSILAQPPGTQYPPYPDIWEWTPEHTPYEEAYTRLRPLRNGDVLVSHSEYNSATNQESVQHIGFFSRKAYETAESALITVADDAPEESLWEARLRGGDVVKLLGSLPCDQGTNSRIQIRDESDSVVREVALILLTESPIWNRSVVCEEQEVSAYSASTVVFYPGRVLLLDDGTFLVSDLRTGMVIRLDLTLDTKSTSLGSTLFLVDPDELVAKVRELLGASSGIEPNWQRIYEDLATWGQQRAREE